MEEPEEYIQRSFNISKIHLRFLEDINENTNLALRTVLNSIIRNNDKIKIKQILDEILLYVGFGLFFFMLSFIAENILVTVVTMMLGVFFLTYGAIGGVIYCGTRNKEKKMKNHKTQHDI